jgi:uncharacterized protein (DUF2225 family)
MSSDDRELKVSFFSKKEYVCPACDAAFHKEELLTGGGRLIAGTLTRELHRLYEPSQRYGKVYPLVYQVIVCPVCWFASMETDFPLLPDADRVWNDKHRRKAEALLIFPDIDFELPRRLMEGAASQYLALRCYEYYPKQFSPTIKMGIASIRTAWLLDELDKAFPRQHYDWLATLFRKKAEYLYNDALSREQSGGETMSAVKSFGPDIDKNYAYEGMLYMCAYLRWKYGSSQGFEDRKNSLETARRTIAKLFGHGKSSKEKPGAFLDLARKVYDSINTELEIGNTA